MTDRRARNAGRQTDREAVRQADRQTGRKAGSQTDRQTRVPIKLGLVDGND